MGPFFRRAFSTNKCKFTGGGGVTLSRQGDLLRLGVPKLEDSAAKFVKVARPFLSQDELATTAKLAEDLCAEGGKGHKLQKLLEERASLKDNWVLINLLLLLGIYRLMRSTVKSRLNGLCRLANLIHSFTIMFGKCETNIHKVNFKRF